MDLASSTLDQIRSERVTAKFIVREVDRTVKKFRSFAEAEKADREFYKNLTGNERLQILVDLLNHGPEQRLERVSRIVKLPRR
jgi:vacuolar-type H+-ATPase subunit B/Vma2